MRSIIEGTMLRDTVIRDRMKLGTTTLTISATYTMTEKADPVQVLTTTAARTVLLPAEARGLFYYIVNASTANADITVKEDSNTTTIAIVPPGTMAMFVCDGTSWYAPSDIGLGGAGGAPVEIADAASYTVLAANSGRLHVVPDVTASITITLPTPDEGLNYDFVYGGVAADAQNHIWTGGAGNFFKGNLSFQDLDAGAGADELVAVFGNGSSHITLTVTTPANYQLNFACNGTLWYVTGYALSNTAAAFS